MWSDMPGSGCEPSRQHARYFTWNLALFCQKGLCCVLVHGGVLAVYTRHSSAACCIAGTQINSMMAGTGRRLTPPAWSTQAAR